MSNKNHNKHTKSPKTNFKKAKHETRENSSFKVLSTKVVSQINETDLNSKSGNTEKKRSGFLHSKILKKIETSSKHKENNQSNDQNSSNTKKIFTKSFLEKTTPVNKEPSKNRFGKQSIDEKKALLGLFGTSKKVNIKKKKDRVVRTIVPYILANIPKENCVICSKQITQMSQAIFDSEKVVSAHFDCIMEDLKKRYQLKQGQRVTYLGNNQFGVIEDIKAGNSTKFKIISSIDAVSLLNKKI